MHTNDFEGALDRFLNSREYDRFEEAVYQFARTAFEAGWKAAGGVEPDSEKIIDVLNKSIED